MNETTGLRQRSKRTKKLIIAGAMAAAVGGFGVAITLPANAASVPDCPKGEVACRSNEKKGPKRSATEKLFVLTGRGASPKEARFDLKDACANSGGVVIRIKSQYTRADDNGQVFFADGICSVGENQLR